MGQKKNRMKKNNICALPVPPVVQTNIGIPCVLQQHALNVRSTSNKARINVTATYPTSVGWQCRMRR